MIQELLRRPVEFGRRLRSEFEGVVLDLHASAESFDGGLEPPFRDIAPAALHVRPDIDFDGGGWRGVRERGGVHVFHGASLKRYDP